MLGESQEDLLSCAPGAADEAFSFDTSKVQPTYVNFCRITSTPEEIVIDFGFLADVLRDTQVPIVAPERISLNPYTASRLLRSLRLTIEHHEKLFGPVEADLTKRLGWPQE